MSYRLTLYRTHAFGFAISFAERSAGKRIRHFIKMDYPDQTHSIGDLICSPVLVSNGGFLLSPEQDRDCSGDNKKEIKS